MTPYPRDQDNIPESYLLPLLFFLIIWLTSYYQAVLSPNGKPNGFDSSIFLSNLNSIVLVIMATLSLMGFITERIPSCWSSSYFIVDVLDCIVRRDVMWGFHGFISLLLNVLTARSAAHRGLRSASKGFFTEASTPFFNYWKTHKSYKSFLTFFASFTLCRIVWVPFFVYRTYAFHLDGEIDYLMWPSVMFYVLQLFWYAKMVGMIFHYKTPEEIREEHMKKKKN
eukprot:CCRYP_007242-RA/>CCRYP_007242-RA protein AED:0.05 eAED:0.05 QI:432/1/1/1/1/1/2/363/224